MMMTSEVSASLLSGSYNTMANPLTKVLKDGIEGATVKEIDLRSETLKEKRRRKKLKKLLEESGLGDPSRDKRRFVKEDK
jgi:hypothetical protein